MINVTNQAKKPFSNRFGSPGLLNKGNKSSEERNSEVKFIGEMKKHGIMSALDDMNKFSEFFNSKPGNEEDLKNSTIQSTHNEKSANSYHFTESQSTQMMSSNEFINSKYKHVMASGKVEHHKTRFESVDQDSKGAFLFPFQRRARSHSPPSKSEIQSKIAKTIINNRDKERSWSKSAENNKSIPVVANASFIIGGIDLGNHKKLGQRVRKELNKEEKRMMDTKEVEEWLSNNLSPDITKFENQVLSKNLNFEEFLDENDIISQVSNSLNKNKKLPYINKLTKKVEDTINEQDDWMYQTVGSFNGSKSRERNSYSQTEGKENDCPNINFLKIEEENSDSINGASSKINTKKGKMKYKNTGDKILEELTFSIEGEEKRDYDDLETYIQN